MRRVLSWLNVNPIPNWDDRNLSSLFKGWNTNFNLYLIFFFYSEKIYEINQVC